MASPTLGAVLERVVSGHVLASRVQPLDPQHRNIAMAVGLAHLNASDIRLD
jgi:hypothetical protein